jgi:hypothetical protein
VNAVRVTAWAVWTPGGVWVNTSPRPGPSGGRLAPWPETSPLEVIHQRARRPHRQAVALVQLAHLLLSTRAADTRGSPEKPLLSEMDLLLGTALGSAEADSEFVRGLVERGSGLGSPSTFVYTLPTAAPAEVALALGLRGALATVSAGSVSGLFAVARAVTHVGQGRASACLTGGFELGLPVGSLPGHPPGELMALFLLEPGTSSSDGPLLSEPALGFDSEWAAPGAAPVDSASTLLALAAACADVEKRTAVEIAGRSLEGYWAHVCASAGART